MKSSSNLTNKDPSSFTLKPQEQRSCTYPNNPITASTTFGELSSPTPVLTFPAADRSSSIPADRVFTRPVFTTFSRKSKGANELSSCAAKQYYGINDLTTAEWIARELGQHTIRSRTSRSTAGQIHDLITPVKVKRELRNNDPLQ